MQSCKINDMWRSHGQPQRDEGPSQVLLPADGRRQVPGPGAPHRRRRRPPRGPGAVPRAHGLGPHAARPHTARAHCIHTPVGLPHKAAS